MDKKTKQAINRLVLAYKKAYRVDNGQSFLRNLVGRQQLNEDHEGA